MATEDVNYETAPKSGGMFSTSDGKNYLLVFALVSSLFFLWALCNGMIDVMDKHFQDYLHLSKSESAWVQFAHYVGYFLMAMPAAWLGKKLGYKGGIISGLAMVAAGCLWFIPACDIPKDSAFAFPAVLIGVCFIAMGLTFLETIANPYTTVLGAPRYSAFRINLAQSCNGIGWILGPIVGGHFFYADKTIEENHASLWVPYTGIAVGVILLIIVFAFVKLPDLVGTDTCHVDDKDADADADRQIRHGLSYTLMALNACVLVGIMCAIVGICVSILGKGESCLPAARSIAGLFGDSTKVGADQAPWILVAAAFCVLSIVAACVLYPVGRRMHAKSIWSHPHFSSATLAQFFYVAAQAGIFSFFINYMVAEVPHLSQSQQGSFFIGGEKGMELKDGLYFINELGATKLLASGFALFLLGRFKGAFLLSRFSAHKLLGIYAVACTVLSAVVMMKLGWISVLSVFGTFFFMSIMFPTIFALGIFGLGSKTKIASSFIVMGITGGAMMPKVMGWVGDHWNMSVAFIVPLICFVLIALYAFSWSWLSGSKNINGVSLKGH